MSRAQPKRRRAPTPAATPAPPASSPAGQDIHALQQLAQTAAKRLNRKSPRADYAQLSVDFNALQAAYDELEKNLHLLGDAFDNMQEGLAMFSRDDTLAVANHSFAAMLALPVDDGICGASLSRLLDSSPLLGEALAALPPAQKRVLANPRGRKLHLRLPAASGRTIELKLLPRTGGLYIVTIIDVTAQCQAEAKLEHMAKHDGLTGLQNRYGLAETMARAVAGADAASPCAIMCVDLDRFKQVNDEFGHSVGDQLLVAAGERMRAVTGEDNVVARLGGDEFAVVMPGAGSPGEVGTFADALIAALRKPFHLNGHSIEIAASIGISIAPEHGRCAEAHLAQADLALYRAKKAGKQRFHIFGGTND